MKNDQHPHSEDAGRPYDHIAIIRAQTLEADDLRRELNAEKLRSEEQSLGLRAIIAIANEARNHPGCADGYLERIIERAGDALHAGQEGEE